MQSILLAGTILGADTVIKKKREYDTAKKEYLSGHVQIMTYHNYGAFLNSGDKKPAIVKGVSILLTLLLTVLFVVTFTKFGNRELRMGLAFLLGGAYSNTYDRIKKGFVTDYLNFPKLPGKLGKIVYNVSDFCILIGCCLIVIKQK